MKCKENQYNQNKYIKCKNGYYIDKNGNCNNCSLTNPNHYYENQCSLDKEREYFNYIKYYYLDEINVKNV